MSRITPTGWLAVGTLLASSGVAVGVAYWIFTQEGQGRPEFWEAPGIISVVLIVLGVVALGSGLIRKNDRPAAVRGNSTQDRPARPEVSQRANSAAGGQTTQVANVSSEGDITISPEQRNA